MVGGTTYNVEKKKDEDEEEEEGKEEEEDDLPPPQKKKKKKNENKKNKKRRKVIIHKQTDIQTTRQSDGYTDTFSYLSQRFLCAIKKNNPEIFMTA